MKFKVFRFKNVKSTNDTAIRILRKNDYKFGMIISEKQNKGKGQYGRKWISLKGNLFISFFYSLENLKIPIDRLTKFNCIIVKRLIAQYYKKEILYKKPNDLLIVKKKICGILQETVYKFDKKFLIVGIGLNLIKSPNIKNYPTISLYELINKKIPKRDIENKIKNIFEVNLTKFYKLKKIK